ncbi:MAG: 50S ribosomal protein L11 methyltransferase [Bacteroidales bacterium]|jgi:ribosomal protein L11 methyltransferase|nr:50S ribosomal protein L11 methyltransferase [Bacteroidales bacterium]
MEYIELKCTYPEKFSGEEILPAVLGEIGFESFVETDEGLSAYIPKDNFSEKELNEILSMLSEKIETSVVIIPDQNWNELWERNFDPVWIGNQCIVRAPFHEKPENILYDLIIEPRMAFGTAHHATTFQMLQYLLKEDVKGKKVLDMGCGTGVIAILAEILGAKSITAVDNDEWAYNNAMDNFKLNNIHKTKALLGDASSLGDEIYNVIFANINRNILLQDMKAYTDVLCDNGIIFFSGFYTEDNDAIIEEAKKCHLKLTETSEKENWSALKFTKNRALEL